MIVLSQIKFLPFLIAIIGAGMLYVILMGVIYCLSVASVEVISVTSGGKIYLK